MTAPPKPAPLSVQIAEVEAAALRTLATLEDTPDPTVGEIALELASAAALTAAAETLRKHEALAAEVARLREFRQAAAKHVPALLGGPSPHPDAFIDAVIWAREIVVIATSLDPQS